jgi:hypothetical protein
MYVCVFWKCPLLCLWKYACLRACVMRLSMYVFCTYVSEHVYIRMYLSIYIYKYNIYIHTYKHTHIHKYIRTYTHTYIHTHTHIHTHTYIPTVATLHFSGGKHVTRIGRTRAQIHTHTCCSNTQVYKFIHKHTPIHVLTKTINVCIYIYIHMYTHRRDIALLWWQACNAHLPYAHRLHNLVILHYKKHAINTRHAFAHKLKLTRIFRTVSVRF